MVWDPQKPYDDLPPLPPKADVETRRVLKATIGARAALAHFDARALALPNPNVLLNALSLLEAQASSEIENIVTTTDELFTAAVTDVHATGAAREALRYRTALYVGFDVIGKHPLTSQTAVDVCRLIRGHDEGVRGGEVFIGNPVTHARAYTPPATREVIVKLLDNWSVFVNGSDNLDPIVRMAVAHYQFEAIHPFTDGNGRTGRIMNVLMLCDAGLLSLPVLYLSRHIIETKDEYYHLLEAVTSDGAWEDWITYLVSGVEETARRSLTIVDGITTVQHTLMTTIRTAVGSANHDVLAVLMEQPYVRARDIMRRCAVTRQTASRWLHVLEDAGVLSHVKVGREVLFVNLPLMAVLRGTTRG